MILEVLPVFHMAKAKVSIISNLICVMGLSLTQFIHFFVHNSLLKRSSSAKELRQNKAGPEAKEKRPGTGNSTKLQLIIYHKLVKLTLLKDLPPFISSGLQNKKSFMIQT